MIARAAVVLAASAFLTAATPAPDSPRARLVWELPGGVQNPRVVLCPAWEFTCPHDGMLSFARAVGPATPPKEQPAWVVCNSCGWTFPVEVP